MSGTYRWYEAPLGTTLFFLTNTPAKPADYEAQYTTDLYGQRTYSQFWGQGSFLLQMSGDPSQALPINTGDLYGVYGGGLTMVVPRQVSLVIRYYQVNKGTKRIVNGNLLYVAEFQCHTLTGGSLYQLSLEASGIEQCPTDVNGKIASKEYQLEVRYFPLSWYALLNSFQFTPPIYILFFLFAGLLTVFMGVLVYVINRLLTRLRYPPKFRGLALLYAISMPCVFGCSLGVGSTLIAVLIVWQWLMPSANGGAFCSSNLTDPTQMTPYCFENVTGSWLGIGNITAWRNGRKGIALVFIGVLVIFQGARLLNPVWTEEQRRPDNQKEKPLAAKSNIYSVEDEDAPPPSKIFQPQIWKRANFTWMACFMVFILMIHMEFSYSNIFTALTNEFILIFKVLYFIIENFVLDYMLGEVLLGTSLMGAADVISDIVTMGAPNFITFLLSYVAQNIVLNFIEVLYANRAALEVINLFPRWLMMLKRGVRINKRMTREMKAKEELEWRRINEEIELNHEGIEPLLDCLANYSINSVCVMVNPISYTLLLLFYAECQVASNYFILLNQIAYFIGFPGFIIPFKFITDTFVLNSLELIYGWKVYDYLSYMQYRFSVRDHRWVLQNTILDESISEGMQTIDLMCFSSQFYFLCGFVSFGIIVIVVGISIIERQAYNPFGDPVLPVIFVLIILLCLTLRTIYFYLADIKIRRLGWRGLWMTRQIEGTIDDDVAAKLAVGLGRQEDLERERLELQALNSDRFRHKFLERNRPWILQHLVELLTPRSLEAAGPDGRPAVEYVRDVYAELLAMGEGLHRPGEREDISEDEEDELEMARRNWSRKALSGASLAIAKLWLAKARKRRAFWKLVKGVVDQHKKASCDVCGRNPEQHDVNLLVFLATQGDPDSYAIDRLIAVFEDQYGVTELDVILWKAFFRAHAEYCTRCSICMENNDTTQKRAPGPRITRPQDISSDEDDEEAAFEPLVVSRSSDVGRMMTKWLNAARRKLGGTFPRNDARKQMDRYAEKLRRLKLRKAREETFRTAGLLRDEQELEKKEELSLATKALAIRWLRKARDSMTNKFRGRTDALKEELGEILLSINEEDDWYYGGNMRLEGADLLSKGEELQDDRRALEAEAVVKIRKIEDDVQKYLVREEANMARERRSFEVSLAEINARIDTETETRQNELMRTKEATRIALEQVAAKTKADYGALSSEMVQSHITALANFDAQMLTERNAAEGARAAQTRDMRLMFEKTEKIQTDEMSRRRVAALDSCARIRLELSARLKAREHEWQVNAGRWLSLARRKVEVKKREDAEAMLTKKRRKGQK